MIPKASCCLRFAGRVGRDVEDGLVVRAEVRVTQARTLNGAVSHVGGMEPRLVRSQENGRTG